MRIVSGLLALCLPAVFTHCGADPDPPLSAVQARNLHLTKTFQLCLRRHDWPGVARLYAPTVCYKGRDTRFAPMRQARAQMLARWRKSGTLELRQVYTANEHHVIVEGLLGDTAHAPTRPVCLIYTIEGGLITREYAYDGPKADTPATPDTL